jgi:hypothetical protein
MAIYKFREERLAKYYFDTDRDCVMSLHSGQAKPMKWCQYRNWYPRRVSLVSSTGRKLSYTYDEIKSLLKSEPVREAKIMQPVPQGFGPAPVESNDLRLIKPDFDYVVFSTENKCSQYFFAGTSLKEALERLAKRGEHLKPEHIRVLNTQTWAVTKLTVKRVETYILM